MRSISPSFARNATLCWRGLCQWKQERVYCVHFALFTRVLIDSSASAWFAHSKLFYFSLNKLLNWRSISLLGNVVTVVPHLICCIVLSRVAVHLFSRHLLALRDFSIIWSTAVLEGYCCARQCNKTLQFCTCERVYSRRFRSVPLECFSVMLLARRTRRTQCLLSSKQMAFLLHQEQSIAVASR